MCIHNKIRRLFSVLFAVEVYLFEMKFLLVLIVLSVMLSASMAARKLHLVYYILMAVIENVV